MPFDYIPILEIFLSILGFGLSIMFCTTFCRVCSRIREEQFDREERRRGEQDMRHNPIFFIPFHPDGEDHHRVPRHSQELHAPPRYSGAAYSGPPPSYNELGLKPEDLPPAYTEYTVPVYTDMLPPRTQPQQ